MRIASFGSAANCCQREDWDLLTPMSESFGVAPCDFKVGLRLPRPLSRSPFSAISVSSSPARISARILSSVAWSFAPTWLRGAESDTQAPPSPMGRARERPAHDALCG
jgi:hypothetical protein